MRVFLFLYTTLFLFSAGAADFKVPRLKGPVNDYSGILSHQVAQQLKASLIKIKRSGGSEIAVLTVPDLADSTIEQAAIQVTDKWKLGGDAKDNGVLLLIAKKEKRIRIEVGQGLEGLLTDAHSKRIITETMTPLFRSGNMSQGVLLGLYQIAEKTNPNLDVKSYFGSQNWQASRSPRRRSRGFGFLPILILIGLMFMGGGRRGGSGRMLLAGMLLGGLGGRSGGGGGGGSGGFGGGGGFSGGGASGGW